MPKSKRTVPLEGNRSTHPCLARLKAKSVLLPTIDPVKRTSLVRIDILNSDGQLVHIGRQSVECADENEERYYQVIGGLQEGERFVSGGNSLIDAETQVQRR